LKAQEFADADFWLIPLNIGQGWHWILLVLDLYVGQAYFFDSLIHQNIIGGKKALVAWIRSKYDVILETVFRWGQSVELLQPHHQTLREMPIMVLERPRQSNGYDCGVWVVAVGEALLRNLPPTVFQGWTESMTIPMRYGMALSLAANELPMPVWDYGTVNGTEIRVSICFPRSTL